MSNNELIQHPHTAHKSVDNQAVKHKKNNKHYITTCVAMNHWFLELINNHGDKTNAQFSS